MASKKKRTKKKGTRKKTARRQAQNSPPKASFKPGKWHVNQTAAAEFCGVSVQVFQRRGIEPAGRHGRYTYYDLRSLRQLERDKGYEQGRAEERKRFEKFIPEGTDLSEVNVAEVLLKKELAELRWTEERGEGQALKNARMRRELAPVQMVSWVLGRIGAQISAVLGPLPSKIKHRLPSLTTAEIHIIKAEIAKAKNLASEASVDWDEFDFEPGSEPDGD